FLAEIDPARLLRREQLHRSIASAEAEGMKHKFVRQLLLAHPRHRFRGRVKAVYLHAVAPDEGQVERGVVANAKRVGNRAVLQSLGQNLPAVPAPASPRDPRPKTVVGHDAM